MNDHSNDFMSKLGAPAKRALLNAGITTIKKLATCTEKEILALHGVGKSSIPKLKAALKEKGFDFRPVSKKPK